MGTASFRWNPWMKRSTGSSKDILRRGRRGRCKKKVHISGNDSLDLTMAVERRNGSLRATHSNRSSSDGSVGKSEHCWDKDSAPKRIRGGNEPTSNPSPRLFCRTKNQADHFHLAVRKPCQRHGKTEASSIPTCSHARGTSVLNERGNPLPQANV